MKNVQKCLFGLSVYPNNPFGVCYISHKWVIQIGVRTEQKYHEELL